MGVNLDMSIFSYESITGNSEPKIEIDESDAEFLNERTILITGAGGSIGSTIATLLSRIKGVKILAFDRDENALHSLSLSISNTALFTESRFILGDVRDPISLDNVYKSNKVDVVIHCAALKHLAVLEKYPREAALTNILGTSNVIDRALHHEVPYLLNVSTDKAASPVSILGKSKRVAELLLIKKRNELDLNFTNVRFGNVFNSRGSVIETFIHQIRHGLPVTLTNPDVSRYFMHIEEAAALTIKSMVLNQGGIHVLEMGEPVKIIDIINRIKAFYNSQSEIVITGLREGEKLHEDLLSSREIRAKTLDSKIDVISSDNPGLEPPSLDELLTDQLVLLYFKNIQQYL